MKAYIFSKTGESVKIVKGIPEEADRDKTKNNIMKKMSLTKKNNSLIFVCENVTVEKFEYESIMKSSGKKPSPMPVAKDLVAYTDGGYHIYKDEGAFAFVLLQDGKIIKKEASVIRGETNNRGELKAILAAVRNSPDGSKITINSDSQYAINTLEGTWARRKNTDLFDEWDRLLAEKKVTVKFNWVRGHNGNEYNEMCDRMCNEAVGYDLNSWIPKKN